MYARLKNSNWERSQRRTRNVNKNEMTKQSQLRKNREFTGISKNEIKTTTTAGKFQTVAENTQIPIKFHWFRKLQNKETLREREGVQSKPKRTVREKKMTPSAIGTTTKYITSSIAKRNY